jgi:iron(III) transport system substrate-binding protein
MEPKRRGRRAAVIAAAALALVAILAGVVALTSGSGNDLTVYTARSHYGEEQPFKNYENRTGEGVELFGGSASELYERLSNERADTSADLLITVDAANLWRAKEDGLLAPVQSATLERNVPAELRDPDNTWFGLTQRARTIMRSTERVPESEAPDTYEALGDPQWRGRLCLRSGTSEYNVSFVADRLVKDGDEATEKMLRSWMANEPQILGSDVDVLDAIAGGQCDIGLTNTYYLGRELEEDPDFPVAPVFADQDGRGTHVNLSGVGLVRWARHRARAIGLMEFLTAPAQQETLASSNHEFAVAEGVEPTPEIAQFGDFKRDPIDVAEAGARLDDALALMSDVGWR